MRLQGRWLFLRAYLTVAALVLVAGWVLDQFLAHQAESNALAQDRQRLRGSFAYLESELRNLSATERRAQLARLGAELGYPLVLYPMSDFFAINAADGELAGGDILMLFDPSDQPVFYRRIDDGWVVALGPIPAGDTHAFWVVPLFYLLVALAVFVWVRPLGRDLQHLRAAALDLGSGDFNRRIQLSPGSWLGPLATAFNTMAERIQWLLSSHKELTSAVSHELRTPLSRLKFGLEMLPLENKEQNQQLRYLHQDIDELNELIGEMLRYAELDQRHLQPDLDLVELYPWLADVVALYRSQLNAENISVELNCPQGQGAVMDARLMQRALNNLISNARRYARAQIRIDLAVAEGNCTLSVADDGPGIPEDKRALVTTAFTRLEGREGDQGSGFGLGLAIVQRILELHRGRLDIGRDPVLNGARISISWPATTPI